MSIKSSFREQLERRGDTKVESRPSSYSPVDVLIQMHGELLAPVSLASLLKEHGLTLTEAHAAVTKLAADQSIVITLHPSSLRNLLGELGKLGLTAYAVRDTSRMRVLVPAELLPPEPHASGDKRMSALQTSLSKKTVGDMRQIYGKAFAQNYRSSARLSDVLYSMDSATLEMIAEGEVRDRHDGP